MTTPTSLPATQTTAQPPATRPQRELQALLDRSTNVKKRRNVERVWTALEDMRARKEKDFSLASVAKSIERLGLPGPKYQSLRNKEGADFRALIDAYRQTHGKAPTSAKADDADEDLPLAITDPRIQHRVRVLLRHVRALEDRNGILHDELAKTRAALTAGAPSGSPPEEAVSGFTPDERRAVKDFMHRLEAVGLRADEETGCILDAISGREIAPPYFLDALRRIATQS